MSLLHNDEYTAPSRYEMATDPTALTTQQLLREIASLKELVFTRLSEMDKAILLFDKNLNRFPTDIDKQIEHLREVIYERFAVHDERFISVQNQFSERDTRTEQMALQTKTAVDAALQAAEKAVGKQNEASSLSIAKSENSTNKQIEQIVALIQQTANGTAATINDIKERITRIESEDRGQKTAKTTQETSNTSLVSVIGLVVGTLVAIGGILVAFFGKT